MKVCPAVLELLHVERPRGGHGEAITLSFCKILLRLRRGPDKSDHRFSVCHAEGPLFLSLQEAIIFSASPITATSSVTDIAYY
jgi:hypothetical protein